MLTSRPYQKNSAGDAFANGWLGSRPLLDNIKTQRNEWPLPRRNSSCGWLRESDVLQDGDQRYSVRLIFNYCALTHYRPVEGSHDIAYLLALTRSQGLCERSLSPSSQFSW